jgi:hypothetical protein
MLETVIVIALVVAAGVFLAIRVYRRATGRTNPCGQCGVTSCPMRGNAQRKCDQFEAPKDT